MALLLKPDKLPLILAGPMVRRVTLDTVSVWVALKEARTVKLSIWKDRQKADAANPLFEKESKTISFGKNLHIAVVMAKRAAGDELTTNTEYAYNLTFKKEGDTGTGDTLQSLGLLADPIFSALVAGKKKALQLPLGYARDFLPSFLTPPEKLEDYCIAHSSCRLSSGRGRDAMRAADFLIEKSREPGPNKQPRPHRLFLTGDQIYADDVTVSLLPFCTDLGNALLFGDTGSEELTIESKNYKVTRGNFPSGARSQLITQKAGFSTTDRRSHLMAFGEFAAMYLMAWSGDWWLTEPGPNDLWNAPILPAYGIRFEKKIPTDELKTRVTIEELTKVFNTIIGNETPEAGFDLGDFVHFGDELPVFPNTPEKAKEDLIGIFSRQLENYADFREATPYLRRAFANTPTFMIFDDHEVTDDWNMNKQWATDVYSKTLGKNIVRNGLLAYTLFQAWGNDPESFERDPDKKRLLELLPKAFKTGDERTTALTELDVLLGLNNDDKAPRVRWDYRVPGSPLETLVLDTRTRRKFGAAFDPAGLIEEKALKEQLPKLTDLFGATAQAGQTAPVLVVSPVPALGLQTLEDVVQPIIIRVDNIKNESKFGFFNRDFEAWSFNLAHYERLLKRLSAYRRVILLSGDVHYGISSVMDYWRNDTTDKATTEDFVKTARFVQLVASGAKNERGEFQKFLYTLPDLQAVFKGMRLPAVRAGWLKPQEAKKAITLPKKLPPNYRRRLATNPAIMPAELGGTSTARTFSVAPEVEIAGKAPEWSWRLDLLRDNRPNIERPKLLHLPQLPHTPDNGTPGLHYNNAIVVQQHETFTHMNRVVMWNNNMGIVRFDKQNEQLFVSHSFLCYPQASIDPSANQTTFNPEDPDFFTVHRTSLEPLDGEHPANGT